MNINKDAFLVIELPPKNKLKSKIEHNKQIDEICNY
jgi:hypothetical protein